MKNIHVLPTDKPSRLILQGSELLLSKYMEVNEGFSEFNQHLYITADEFIEEGDFALNLSTKNIVQYDGVTGLDSYYKKIILTTDQDLIKDGVQAISDDFLEWFVKNPSCEEVEVDLVPVNEFGSEITVNGYGFDKFIYKITIPKEKPKPEYSKIKEGLKKSIKGKEHFIHHFKNGGTVEDFKPLETLEEAAKKLFGSLEKGIGADRRNIWMNGAKWQQERMYSEEEVMSILINSLHSVEIKDQKNYSKIYNGMKEWFEQNKKK